VIGGREASCSYGPIRRAGQFRLSQQHFKRGARIGTMSRKRSRVKQLASYSWHARDGGSPFRTSPNPSEPFDLRYGPQVPGCDKQMARVAPGSGQRPIIITPAGNLKSTRHRVTAKARRAQSQWGQPHGCRHHDGPGRRRSSSSEPARFFVSAGITRTLGRDFYGPEGYGGRVSPYSRTENTCCSARNTTSTAAATFQSRRSPPGMVERYATSRVHPNNSFITTASPTARSAIYGALCGKFFRRDVLSGGVGVRRWQRAPTRCSTRTTRSPDRPDREAAGQGQQTASATRR